MPTKPELEEDLERVETRLQEADDTVAWLLEQIRDEHDAHHEDPWQICRHTVCREAADAEGEIERRRLFEAS